MGLSYRAEFLCWGNAGMQPGGDGASLCPLLTLLAPARHRALGWTSCSGSTAGVCEQEILSEVLLTALCFQLWPPETQIWGSQALLHRDLWGVFPCSPFEDPESLVPLLAKSNTVIFS